MVPLCGVRIAPDVRPDVRPLPYSHKPALSTNAGESVVVVPRSDDVAAQHDASFIGKLEDHALETSPNSRRGRQPIAGCG
jgi:hypothetical protein